jgi:hypothetical protein
MSAEKMAGLTALSDVELETIARAVRQGLTPSPLTASALAELSVGDRAGWLVGLDTEAVMAAIIAVLAERGRGEDTKVDLVWTGPDVAASAARDTAVVNSSPAQNAASWSPASPSTTAPTSSNRSTAP